MNKHIGEYYDKGLCISCGICAGNCPIGCIEMKPVRHSVRQTVNEKACLHCGKCRAVCPNMTLNADDSFAAEIEMNLLGKYKGIYCSKAKNKELLRVCTSGGIITSCVSKLLHDGEYQSAFLIEGYEYSGIRLKTKRFTKESSLIETAKSRYLTVDHSGAVRYLLAHKDERIIFVGSPCAIVGLEQTIKQNKLERGQYFLIGLFCDKTMSYGVVDYFENYSSKKELNKLFF